MPKSRVILFLAVSIFSALPKCDGWRYNIESFNSTSTDESILAADLKPALVAPDVYGLDGVIKVGADINNDYTLEIKLLRSAVEEIHYKATPLRMPKCSFKFFMNTIYKNIVMNDLSKCSDLPVFEGKFNGVLPAREYRLTSCALKDIGLPKQMPEGLYKAALSVKGPQVELMAELVARLYK